MQYDASIRIGTEINTKGFEDGGKKLESESRRLSKSVSNSTQEAEKSVENLGQAFSETAVKIAELQTKMELLKNQKIPTEEYKEVQKQIESTQKSINNLIERQEKFLATGGKETSSAYKRMQFDLDALKNSLPYFQGELQDLVDTGKAFTLGSETDQFSKYEAQLQKLKEQEAEEQRIAQIRESAVASNDQIIAKVERLKQLEQEIADLKAAERTEGYADYDNRIIEAEQLKQDIRDYRDSLSEVPERFSRMRAAAQKAFNAIRSGLSTIGKVGKKAFSGIFSMAKKLFSSITSGSKQSNASLSGGLKTILRYGFGIRSVYALFNKIRNGIKEGFTNLMGYSDDFANSIQSVKNSMSTLGNQIAAAFAPIVQMVIPWINQLISALSTAMTYVAQFIAALTGSNTFTKATQIQDKYNKSLGGTAKAADKARGALAKFDDLDVLQKQEDTSGGGGAAVTDPADMFEEAKVSDKWKNIADWFREMWENSDFYALGKLLGEKLKNALENIDWSPIKETARKIGESLTTLINGFIGVEGLGFTIGNTLAQAFNTGFEFLNAFIHNLNWDSVGEFIADTINGFFTGIDWNLIYDTFVSGAKGLGDAINSFFSNIDIDAITDSISNFVNTFVDTIYTFFTTVDWLAIGHSIGKFITDSIAKIDWGKMGQTVSIMLTSILDLIISTVETIDWSEIWKAIIDFLTNVNWLEILGKIVIAAYNLIDGIVVGLIQAIAETDWGAIWDSILQAFKDFFGIHSPSTVMEDMGMYIMEGLIAGIESLVSSVIEIWNVLKQSTLEIFEDLWVGIKKTINGMLGGVETMANGIVRAVNKMIEALNSIKFSIPDWVPGDLGGKSFGLNLSTIPEVSIPRLATGAVIRGGNPFAAILGDQPHGQTNIEAPLATIEQAVENVMNRRGYNNMPAGGFNPTISLNVDGQEFARLTLGDILQEASRQGYDVSVLGVT